MKTTLKTLVAVTAISLNTTAQTNWNVDGSHSKLGFAVTHMMVSETEGKFKIYEGKVSSVKADADFTDANKTIWFRYKVNVKEHITHYELGLPVKDAPLEELILEYSFDGVNYTKAIETEAKAGRWVGVKSGMFACHDSSKKTEAGYVTVDYVEYK